MFFFQITIPQSAYVLESLEIELGGIKIDQGQFTERDYPFIEKPFFATLGGIIEVSRQEPLNSFAPDDSVRDLLGLQIKHIIRRL